MQDHNIEHQLRSLILSHLQSKRRFGEVLSVAHLMHEIAAKAQTQNLKVRGHDVLIKNGFNTFQPSPHLVPLVWDIVWDLIIEGVIRPGRGDDKYDPKDLHVTPYGTEVLAGTTTPYDPDGYLKAIADAVPAVDAIIVTYVGESARTLRANCPLSSTITLGCASERAFLILLNAYADALNAVDQAKLETALKKALQIKKRHDIFMEWYEKHLEPKLRSGKIHPDAITEFESAMTMLFTYFRNIRNDAGHPTGTSFSREMVHSHLVVFPAYLRAMYGIIDWLRSNTPL